MRTISAIALCLMLVFATTGCAASKIAVVDPARLFQESEPGKAGIEHLKQLEAAMQEQLKTAQGMIDDAHRLLDKIDDKVYPKIPTTEAGILAMRTLKAEGVHVTATAIYSKTQGFLAIASGVDYLAPYYNRMQSIDIDTRGTLAALAGFIQRFDAPSKIMAASFKNISQVSHALESGADAVTLSPKLLRQALSAPDILGAVDDFISDWKSVYGTKTLPED